MLSAEGMLKKMGKGELRRSDQKSGEMGKKHYRSQGSTDFVTEGGGGGQ